MKDLMQLLNETKNLKDEKGMVAWFKRRRCNKKIERIVAQIAQSYADRTFETTKKTYENFIQDFLR
jgi:hypothetical protein